MFINNILVFSKTDKTQSRLNGVPGYPFTGYVEDAGEPQGENDNDQDSFTITVRDPSTNDVVFKASAALDGGNVQIHPPNGSGK